MNLGFTIRSLRKKKGISQIAFARMIGLSQPSLSQIELNQKRPHPSTMQAIAEGLGVKEVFIYLMAMDESDVPEKKRELYRKSKPVLTTLITSLCYE